MDANKAIITARKHLGGQMESSARLCLSDAVEFFNQGKLEQAKKRAIDSLRYSVGILSPIYKKAIN